MEEKKAQRTHKPKLNPDDMVSLCTQQLHKPSRPCHLIQSESDFFFFLLVSQKSVEKFRMWMWGWCYSLSLLNNQGRKGPNETTKEHPSHTPTATESAMPSPSIDFSETIRQNKPPPSYYLHQAFYQSNEKSNNALGIRQCHQDFSAMEFLG